MAINYPGPYEVEINYTVNSLDHVMRFNVALASAPDVGDDPSTIDVVLRSGANALLSSVVASLMGVLRPVYASTCTFTSYTLWRYTPNTFERTYITTGDISLAGTNAGATTLAGYIMLTFRTQEGGVMRVVLLENVVDQDIKQTYANAGVLFQNIFDYFTASTGWALARDTSYPVVPIFKSGGQNEKTWRQRYR